MLDRSIKGRFSYKRLSNKGLEAVCSTKWNKQSKQQTLLFRKNPAYGRQSISRPMRIVAPIQKNPASKAKFTEEEKTFFCAAIVHPL